MAWIWWWNLEFHERTRDNIYVCFKCMRLIPSHNISAPYPKIISRPNGKRIPLVLAVTWMVWVLELLLIPFPLDSCQYMRLMSTGLYKYGATNNIDFAINSYDRDREGGGMAALGHMGFFKRPQKICCLKFTVAVDTYHWQLKNE